MDHGIKENVDVGLHDCRTNKIQIEDQSITFFFPDGFYYIKDSVKESSNAKMRCHLVDRYGDNFSVCIFRKNIFGKMIREDWTDKLVPAVNSGKVEFEFVYTFRAYQYILFKGYIWQDKKPWHRECEVEIRTDEITYSWTDK